jgi:spoIIIJ-associated protein
MQVILDADGYRQQRAEVVAQLAEKLARKVMETGQEISLDPMPAMERKIIHQVVQAYPQITSYSVGIEPQRYVVISLKS